MQLILFYLKQDRTIVYNGRQDCIGKINIKLFIECENIRPKTQNDDVFNLK